MIDRNDRIQRMLAAAVLAPVRAYRRYLSPLKRTPTCIYVPTCSQYAIDAVRQRGIVVGVALAVLRILRCNPLFHGGFHPVHAGACSRLLPCSRGEPQEHV